MKKVFTGMAALLVAAVITQFYLAASGAFNEAPIEESFQPHRMLGYAILVLAILVTIVGAVSRMPGRLIGMAGLVAGLVILQILIREISKAFGDGSTVGHLIFGLHAINGLLIMGVSEEVVRRSRKISWKPAEPVRTAS
jgi:hypothetical protein